MIRIVVAATVLLLAPGISFAAQGDAANAICKGIIEQYDCAKGSSVQVGNQRMTCLKQKECKESDGRAIFVTGECHWKAPEANSKSGGYCYGLKARGTDGKMHDLKVPDISQFSAPKAPGGRFGVPESASPIGGAGGGASEITDTFMKAVSEAFKGGGSSDSGEAPLDPNVNRSGKGDLASLAEYMKSDNNVPDRANSPQALGAPSSLDARLLGPVGHLQAVEAIRNSQAEAANNSTAQGSTFTLQGTQSTSASSGIGSTLYGALEWFQGKLRGLNVIR
jgi:hypothetical protein